MAKANTGTATAIVLSLLRVVVAAIYLEHGLQLVFGMFGGHAMRLTSFAGIGGLIMLIGGSFLLVGLYTRIAAFVLCGEMAVAYFKVHYPHGPNPLTNEGERAVLYCFVFLYFVFAGGGALSLDRAMGRS